MTDPLIMAIAIAAGLLLFWAIFKVVKAIVFAAVVSVLVGGAIFYYLPRMEPTDGTLEEVRQKAVKMTDELKKGGDGIRENLKNVSESISNVAKKADQFLDDTIKTQEAVKDLQNGLEKGSTADSLNKKEKNPLLEKAARKTLTEGLEGLADLKKRGAGE